MRLENAQLGHYRLTQFLKGGGMSEVYLAEGFTLPRQMAIKVMKSEGALYPNLQTEVITQVSISSMRFCGSTGNHPIYFT